jgi:hypothetical protein
MHSTTALQGKTRTNDVFWDATPPEDGILHSPPTRVNLKNLTHILMIIIAMIITPLQNSWGYKKSMDTARK